MDNIKEFCFWLVMIQAASAGICIIILPWLILARYRQGTMPKQPHTNLSTELVVQPMPTPKFKQQKSNRARCTCGKLLPKFPGAVEASQDSTIGTWKCPECGLESKHVIP